MEQEPYLRWLCRTFLIGCRSRAPAVIFSFPFLLQLQLIQNHRVYQQNRLLFPASITMAMERLLLSSPCLALPWTALRSLRRRGRRGQHQFT